VFHEEKLMKNFVELSLKGPKLRNGIKKVNNGKGKGGAQMIARNLAV
jgi:hypothetical protein